ncbi:MAG: hypothetical protein EOP45_11595 [Sphingobacteriaceae bacterium]|nr:MAG: hypothetical protein EOP45_11595 [Sphingobacteriaceae bacterium]
MITIRLVTPTMLLLLLFLLTSLGMLMLLLFLLPLCLLLLLLLFLMLLILEMQFIKLMSLILRLTLLFTVFGISIGFNLRCLKLMISTFGSSIHGFGLGNGTIIWRCLKFRFP